MAAVLKAWAILDPVDCWPHLITPLQLQTRKAEERYAQTQSRHSEEAVESRLQLARELSAEEATAIVKIRTEVRGLQKLIRANFRPKRG